MAIASLPQFHANAIFKVLNQLPFISVQGYNKERRVFYWNKASERLYGYTKEEAQGKLLEDLIIPAPMREGVINGIQEWLTNSVPLPASELDLKHKDGSIVNVFSSHLMVHDLAGQPYMFCVDVDLRE